MEYLDGIVYRALQALGCAAASTAERETAKYQGRVGKRQPTTAIEETRQVTRRQMQFARSRGLKFMSIHLQTRGRVRYGGLLYAMAASRLPRSESKLPTRLLRQDTPAQAPAGDAPCRSVQSSCPQVCPFAPKWMGLIQANVWWASRAARGHSSLQSPPAPLGGHFRTSEDEGTEVAA